MAGSKKTRADARRNRTRLKLKKVANDRPRLSVFRSSKNISAQIIDDVKGLTIVSASSLDKSLRAEISKGSDSDAASKVGEAIAKRAIEAGVKDVVFDRGSYMFHGRIKALANAARDGGLNF